MDDILTRDSV